MQINFREVIAALPGGPTRVVQLANEARPPANYLYNTILPERPEPGWDVRAASMVIRATMAGLVGMDSPYPPGGAGDSSSFNERLAKIAIHVPLSEEQLRHISDLITFLGGQGTARAKEAIAEEVLNFFDKVIVQAQMDRSEWLRGQCLSTGALNWTYNGKTLLVSYGVPAANFLAARTGAFAYAGATSGFWADIRSLQRKLGTVRAFIVGPDLAEDIINNTANNLTVGASTDTTLTVQKRVAGAGGGTENSSDARDRITLIKYAEEGEILDLATPGKTVKVPFHPRTKLIAIGANGTRGYRPGQGSTPDPQNGVELGYHKLGPTIEGGSLGRWGQVFTPENEPWSLHGRGASNELPVLLAPEKVAVATSDVSA